MPIRTLLWLGLLSLCCMGGETTLPGTTLLQFEGDLTDMYLSGLERFTVHTTARVLQEREAEWEKQLSKSAPEAESWQSKMREKLAYILGVRDKRVGFSSPEVVSTLAELPLLGTTVTHDLMRIRWPVCGTIMAEGLLLEPRNVKVITNVVHIPHAGVAPEQLLGIMPGVPPQAVEGFIFPEAGVRMVIPAIISRTKTSFNSDVPNLAQGVVRPRQVQISAREYVFRSAFVMGRHLIGYEVQGIMALLDWFKQQDPRAVTMVSGWGDGGMLSLYAAALDTRIDQAMVAGYFGDRSELWREPLDRNMFGFLRYFGDAEVAALIAPRKLAVMATAGPNEQVVREKGVLSAAGELWPQPLTTVRKEVARARTLMYKNAGSTWITLCESPSCKHGLALDAHPALKTVQISETTVKERESRLIACMNTFNQYLIECSRADRVGFQSRLDFSSPQAFDISAEYYRSYYLENIMGHIPGEKSALNPRTRLFTKGSGYTCYEVLLDVMDDFNLYGFLFVPDKLPANEPTPLVVVQHGRGGSPRNGLPVDQGGFKGYKEISARLSGEHGYLVFAPQNPYTFEDRYRQLNRRAHPVQLSLYSYIYCQYEQMFNWFRTLPMVDMQRVAFIGQSYGGKTAVRIPPLLKEFCLAICTGDFNEGILKMGSTRYPFSFPLTDEYEIFEFDMGSTFNYSDLAGLMIPRPFMAQRGHADGVAWDEFVGYEYALLQQLYTRVGIPDRTHLQWFNGGHEIDFDSALEFLNQHLR